MSNCLHCAVFFFFFFSFAHRCSCVCWSVFSGLQWGGSEVLKLHCDLSRAYRMGENWQPLKRYYMGSRSPCLCLTGALGMKRKSSGKRDISSRHGEVFVSILSVPSLSRNPNFHYSPTYRQIKASWRGGFPQLRRLVTSLRLWADGRLERDCGRGERVAAHKASRVRGGWSADFKWLWIEAHWASVFFSKGRFSQRSRRRTVTHGLRIPIFMDSTQHIADSFLIMSASGPH